MTDDPRDPDPVSAWHRLAGTSVLLDGFHALKHAVRFQAEVPVAVTANRRAALALADDLAPDVRDALDALLTEVPEATLPGPRRRARIPRRWPPWRYVHRATPTCGRWHARPAPRPWSSSTSRATSATPAP